MFDGVPPRGERPDKAAFPEPFVFDSNSVWLLLVLMGIVLAGSVMAAVMVLVFA